VSYHTNSEAQYVSAEYELLIVTSTGEVMGGKCSAQVTKGTNTITRGVQFKCYTVRVGSYNDLKHSSK
jgi:hypothetical protein